MRVVAIADADSFVKWSASLLDDAPSAHRTLIVVDTALTVSEDQLTTATAHTSLHSGDVIRVRFTDLASRLRTLRPDVAILAGRGPFVRLLGTVIDTLPLRPVTVTGLPGMAIPAQRGALTYRRHADLFIVHSLRERSAFTDLAAHSGVDMPFALATLPFAQRSATPAKGGTDLVFAAQALVPLDQADRELIAALLISAANADPTRRVVVKLRSRAGETETHEDRLPYAALIGDAAPQNLVFSTASMREALARAEGLVTVSSTAAIEAIARGVPVIALDIFGVHKSLLNTAFVGSGLFGSEEAVIARDFRSPAAGWCAENYFHSADETDAWSRVRDLVMAREDGLLPPRRVPTPRGGALHAAWRRVQVLGPHDRSFSGRIARIVGTPLARIAASAKARRTAGRATWADATTDYTLEPNPFREAPLGA